MTTESSNPNSSRILHLSGGKTLKDSRSNFIYSVQILNSFEMHSILQAVVHMVTVNNCSSCFSFSIELSSFWKSHVFLFFQMLIATYSLSMKLCKGSEKRKKKSPPHVMFIPLNFRQNFFSILHLFRQTFYNHCIYLQISGR